MHAEPIAAPPPVAALKIPADFHIPHYITSRAWRYTMFPAAFVVPVLFLAIRLSERGETASAAAAAATVEAVPSTEPVEPAPPPSVAEHVTAPAATATMMTIEVERRPVERRPTTVRSFAKPVDSVSGRPPADRDLLRYQRVGHDLRALQERIGSVHTAELAADFRSIDIHKAIADPATRRAAADLLADLERKIERNRPIELTDACRNNPLAADCR